MVTDKIFYRIVESPVGELIAGATATGCCVLEFRDRGGPERIQARVEKRYRMAMSPGSNNFVDQLESQIREYFTGERTEFNLPLDLKGTRFEMAVWEQLVRIPYGETRAYGKIAAILGKPGAARAVGRANGANYLAVVVPCHRVIQEDGQLRGYGGGLWRKQYLLDLEKNAMPTTQDVSPRVKRTNTLTASL
jgi:AraC family transcriptional regulator of adaptative response/methylated-DNA-[protein]-cysteine methyltransferase